MKYKFCSIFRCKSFYAIVQPKKSSDTSKIGPRFHRSALHSVYCVLAFAALRARAMFQIYKVKILFSSILIDLHVSTTVGLQLLAPR